MRAATPAGQVTVFTNLIDITTARVFGQTMQAHNDLLQTLMGGGKDINIRGHCQSIEDAATCPGQ